MADTSPDVDDDIAAASVVKDAAAVVENAAAVVEDAAAVVAAIAGTYQGIERRRRPRHTRHHESRVHWKHLALYAPILLIVTLLGAWAIWSFFERQSLQLVPEPLPRVTLVTADPRSPLTAAWVRLLTEAEMAPTLVSVEQVEPLQGVVALCDLETLPAPLAASIAEHIRRGGGIAVLGAPPSTPIGPLHLAADRGMSDSAFTMGENPSPILARLTPGYEVQTRPTEVAFLKETPRMRVDARWRTNARAVIMHMEEKDARVVWMGLRPDAVPKNPPLMLLFRTAFRWLDGQPVSDGAVGDAAQAATMTPDARTLARSQRFAFAIERLRDRRSFGIRIANRGLGPIDNPTVQIWLPPGVTQVALAGDWTMKRKVTLNGNPQDGACTISIPALRKNEERVVKLKVVAARR
jgi:hypothetical protein